MLCISYVIVTIHLVSIVRNMYKLFDECPRCQMPRIDKWLSRRFLVPCVLYFRWHLHTTRIWTFQQGFNTLYKDDRGQVKEEDLIWPWIHISGSSYFMYSDLDVQIAYITIQYFIGYFLLSINTGNWMWNSNSHFHNTRKKYQVVIL